MQEYDHHGPDVLFRVVLFEALYWRINMIVAMIATITATMMPTIRGLFIMCRSMPNLVPSGSRSMPHFGHFPEFG
jgi:hypothetical protein